jgi:hypothetical protein
MSENIFGNFFVKFFGKKNNTTGQKKSKKKVGKKMKRDRIRINKLENRVGILINKVIYLEEENKDLHIRDLRNQQSFNSIYDRMKYLEVVNERLQDKCDKCVILDPIYFQG